MTDPIPEASPELAAILSPVVAAKRASEAAMISYWAAKAEFDRRSEAYRSAMADAKPKVKDTPSPYWVRCDGAECRLSWKGIEIVESKEQP